MLENKINRIGNYIIMKNCNNRNKLRKNSKKNEYKNKLIIK